jgi:iron complex transport system ATP-binding protein
VDVQGVFCLRAQRAVLTDVTLRIESGTLCAVVGPNGAGKSSLVLALSGSLPLAQGTIKLFGRDLAGIDRRECARTVAVVAQQEEMPAGFSVREVVGMGRAPHQGAMLRMAAEDHEIIDEAIELVGLGAFAARPAQALSGGEQRRVAFARALAQTPKLLLLDEPATFLDIDEQLRLQSLMATVCTAKGCTVVAVMHDLNAARLVASSAVLLHEGRVAAHGPTKEALSEDSLAKVFRAAVRSVDTGDGHSVLVFGAAGSAKERSAPGDQAPRRE